MKLERFEEWVHSHTDLIIELIRIYLGIGLFIKGIFFLMHPEALSVPRESAWLEWFLPFVPYLHIVGGLLLALGILTRIAALSQIPILFAAVFLVNLPRMSGLGGREGVEFSGLVLFLLVLFAVRGAGGLSVLRYGKPAAAPAPEHSYRRWLDEHPDMFLDAIRIYLGVGLMVKGFYIMQHREEFAALFEPWTGMSVLLMIALHYIVPAHLLGGLMLALGCLTRTAALVQLPPLLGAVFYVYLPHFTALELRQNIEFTLLVLFLLVLLSAYGAGRFSVDRFMERQERRQVEEAEGLQGRGVA